MVPMPLLDTFKAVAAALVIVGSGAQTAPKLPYDNPGACPFECCAYREWTVQKETRILVDRRDEAATRFLVRAGEKVVGVTGVVTTLKFGLVRVERETELGVLRTLVRPGDQILLLHYRGEGTWKYWLRGQFDEAFIPSPEDCRRSADRSPTLFSQCAVQVEQQPDTVWWVTIRNQHGQVGWTREVDHFGNLDACGGRGTRD
jgi:hypothetical protein